MRTAYETAKGFINERREAIIGVVIGTAATLAVGFGVKAIKAAKAIATSEEAAEEAVEETIEEELEALEALEALEETIE